MKRICNNKKCSRSGIVVETSFDETICEICTRQLSETDKKYKDKFFSKDQGKENAKLAWKNMSWMDKSNYKSFDDFYKNADWKSHILTGGNNSLTNSLVAIAVFIFLFIITLIIGVVEKGVSKSASGVSDFFGDRSDHKSYCQTSYQVQNAKTEFAAKKAYEKCISKK